MPGGERVSFPQKGHARTHDACAHARARSHLRTFPHWHRIRTFPHLHAALGVFPHSPRAPAIPTVSGASERRDTPRSWTPAASSALRAWHPRRTSPEGQRWIYIYIYIHNIYIYIYILYIHILIICIIILSLLLYRKNPTAITSVKPRM